MKTSHRFVGATLAFAMVAGAFSPLAVHAIMAPDSNYGDYSIEQLEQLIAKLQRQLEEKRKMSKCFVSDKALSIGDGEPGDGMENDVRRLQMFLKEKGRLKIGATGYFGKMTRAALKEFQSANGLPTTSEFDEATRVKAHSMSCRSALKVKMEIKKPEIKKEYDEEKKADKVSGVNAIRLVIENGMAYWKTDGYSKSGFKVVWSKNAGPTYPTRGGDRYNYLSDPSASKTALEAFDGEGVYHVRVCEYLGGVCGKYSNEVEVKL